MTHVCGVRYWSRRMAYCLNPRRMDAKILRTVVAAVTDGRRVSAGGEQMGGAVLFGKVVPHIDGQFLTWDAGPS